MNYEKLTALGMSFAMTGLIGIALVSQTETLTKTSENPPEVTKVEIKYIPAKGGGLKKYTGKEVDCLAKAMWHEARGETVKGKIAVSEVILNRTESQKYPKDICKVIKQKGQFSFVKNGNIPNIPFEYKKTFKDLAYKILKSKRTSYTNGALFFHAKYVNPNWNYHITTKIGSHIFYSHLTRNTLLFRARMQSVAT